MNWVIAHTDGGSRGNPGPAGFGAVIEDESGNSIARLSQYLGIRTNNFAEYSALIAVLQFAIEHGYKKVLVISDSEVMVRQMKREYKVNNPALKEMWAKATAMTASLIEFQIQHTLRAGNKDADELANRAMDRRGPENGESSVMVHIEDVPLTGAQADALERETKANGANTRRFEVVKSHRFSVVDHDGTEICSAVSEELALRISEALSAN